MHPSSKRRLVGGAAALMLIGATLLSTAGSAIAATTRFIYVGPDANALDPSVANDALVGNGTLSFTTVSAGQQTASNVYVRNIDNQSLTHVVINFPLSQGNGVTIGTTAYGPDGGKCTSDGTNLVCDFGQLKAGATRSFTLVLTAPTAGTGTITGTVVYNESNNPNGGNQQINDITGSLTVGDASCNALAAFLPPGQAKSFLPFDATTCSTDGQRSGLDVPSSANGSTVTINDASTATDCGTYTCFGNVVSANVNNGALIVPYLRWVIFYDNATLGNINPKQVAFLHDTTIIPAGNKGLCKSATSINCQEPYVVSSTGVTFFVRTPTNLLIKGMH